MAEPVKIGVAKEAVLEELRRIYRKQKAAEKVMREKGFQLCPFCHAIWIPKERSICAICENKRKGPTNGQGGRGSIPNPTNKG